MGRRFIRLLDGQLQHLRDHAQHGNRSFFYDQLVVAHLLAFFNPILAGLRKIEDVFDVPALRKRLKMPRVPKSTLADAQRLFDPQLLLPLFEALKQRAAIEPHDPRLDSITRRLLAERKGVRMIFAPAGRKAEGVRTPTKAAHGAKKLFLTPFLWQASCQWHAARPACGYSSPSQILVTNSQSR